MSGADVMFVVDTNVLTQLGSSRRASAFFRKNARIPAEVLHESRGFPDIDELWKNVYLTTATVLNHLARVLETIDTADTELIDLYANEGNADPFVVACALDGRDQDESLLFSPEWLVVTGDRALRDKAKEFGLKVLSKEEFASMIDASQGETQI